CQREAAFGFQHVAVAPLECRERPVAAGWFVALQAHVDRRRGQRDIGIAGEELAAEPVAFDLDARGRAYSAGAIVDDEAATEPLPRDAGVGRVEGAVVDGDGA